MDENFLNQIQLFKSVFKGREDVFAVRWQKENKSGYMPAYFYDPYMYRAHKMKGGTFQNYADKTYLKLTDKEIAKHLTGEQLIGIYPLLSDNSSWFLVADFVPANKNCIMKNLFDKAAYTEITNRINALTPESLRQWGKMNVAQMLAHCKEAFKVPLSDKKMPRMFLGLLFGWMIKNKLHNEAPWKKNLPTAPNFIIKDERDFEKEKPELSDLINRFYNGGPENVGRFPHPMFGAFTTEQWGKSMYKHLDHHFMQFGV